jgi:hypothetical protein
MSGGVDWYSGLMQGLLAEARARSLPAPRVTDDEHGGFEIEFKAGRRFADFDLWEDGSIVVSFGGSLSRVDAREITADGIPEALDQIKHYLDHGTKDGTSHK